MVNGPIFTLSPTTRRCSPILAPLTRVPLGLEIPDDDVGTDDFEAACSRDRRGSTAPTSDDALWPTVTEPTSSSSRTGSPSRTTSGVQRARGTVSADEPAPCNRLSLLRRHEAEGDGPQDHDRHRWKDEEHERQE